MSYCNKSCGVRCPLLVLLPLLLIAVLVALSFRMDTRVREALLEHQTRVTEAAGKRKFHHTPEHRFWSAVSKYGDWPQLMVFGALLIGISVWRRRADWTRVVAAAMLASTLAGAIANTSRLTTGRVRPRYEAEYGAGFLGPWHEGSFTIGRPALNSFPSGHTATAVGFAAPILFFRPLLGFPILLGALAIGLSRMQLGAHHFSDIVVSTLIALAVGWFCLRWVQGSGDEVWNHLVNWFRERLRFRAK